METSSKGKKVFRHGRARRGAMIAAAAALSAASALAHADLPQPNEEPCWHRAAGDACTTEEGGPGQCVAIHTTRPQYEPNGIRSVAVVELICQPLPPPPPPPGIQLVALGALGVG